MDAHQDIPVLHWVDYLVFVLFLLLSAAIGIFYGYKSKIRDVQESAQSFLTGGGQMHFFPVALSLMASFLSAIFVLSIPSEMMVFGHNYVYLAIAYFSGFGIAAHVHLPVYYRLGITSGYEYLEMRYNKTVRVAGALTFSAMTFLYLSVVLYTPALAISQVTALPMLPSILTVGAVCTFYTALGGMRATILNDAIQMIIVFVCFILILSVGTAEVGGLAKVMEYAGQGGRLDVNFDPNPLVRTTFWSHTIGGTFVNLTMYASSQTIIQKFISTKSVREGQKAVWLSCFTTAAALVITMFLGFVMYAYFADCDPVASGRAGKSDQIVPLFVMLLIGNLHGLPGLFLASTFSAALSTVSGSVNALSAVFLEDLIHPLYVKYTKKSMTTRVATIITRILSVVFGLMTIGMSFVAEFLGSTVVQIALSVFGMIGSPLMAILTLGMFLPWINSWGAFMGLIGSLGVTCWVGFGRIVLQIPDEKLPVSIEGCPNVTVDPNATTLAWTSPATDVTLATTLDTPSDEFLAIYDLSYMYYSVLALLVATTIAIPVSLATGRTKNRTFDPRLFFLLPNECWCSCCPSFCTRFFMCCHSKENTDLYKDDSVYDIPMDNSRRYEMEEKTEKRSKGDLTTNGKYQTNAAYIHHDSDSYNDYKF